LSEHFEDPTVVEQLRGFLSGALTEEGNKLGHMTEAQLELFGAGLALGAMLTSSLFDVTSNEDWVMLSPELYADISVSAYRILNGVPVDALTDMIADRLTQKGSPFKPAAMLLGPGDDERDDRIALQLGDGTKIRLTVERLD